MGNLNKVLILSLILLLCIFCMAYVVAATTTCERDGCDITITINMVAVGGNQQVIDDWIQDIESVWNGPVSGDGDSPTYGECDCPVHVEVNFAGWVNNCNDATAAQYHCIEITPDYAKDTAGKTYRGYMKGVSQNGSRTTGWWSSNHMNQPVLIGPGEGRVGPPAYYGEVHDAAHEAGHMMGLEDDYNKDGNTYGNNIMGRTWGEDAKPTQDQIDQIVENNCEGEAADCPDECCCGNGKIESDKGEKCDPMAEPTGCDEDEICVDCECYFSGYCGDGIISEDEGEECDPNAEPTGCMEGETCTEECICEPKIETTLTISITSPPNGATIIEKTTVTIEITSSLGVERVDFIVDNETPVTDNSFPYAWDFDPLDYAPGTHIISASVYDNEGYTASDSIEVHVICGDGICDLEQKENCENCPIDCICLPPTECDPINPASDLMGCALP